MISGLRKQKEIEELFKFGKRKNLSFGRLIVFFEKQDSEKQNSSFKPVNLLIITRKKLGKAVKRNRIRRVIKEAFLKAVRDLEINLKVKAAISVQSQKVEFWQAYREIYDGLKSLMRSYEKTTDKLN